MNPSSTDKPSLRQRFREQAREEALDAALRVFVRDGLAEARIDAIAAEAGVSVGTLYNLFGDRAGLVSAVLERGRLDFLDVLRGWFQDHAADPFDQRLRGLVHLLIGHMHDKWPMMRILSQAEENPAVCRPHIGPDATIVREVYGHVHALVQQGVACGALAAVDPHVATCALMGSIRTTIDVDLALGLDPPTKARADVIVTLFLQGAAPRP